MTTKPVSLLPWHLDVANGFPMLATEDGEAVCDLLAARDLSDAEYIVKAVNGYAELEADRDRWRGIASKLAKEVKCDLSYVGRYHIAEECSACAALAAYDLAKGESDGCRRPRGGAQERE